MSVGNCLGLAQQAQRLHMKNLDSVTFFTLLTFIQPSKDFSEANTAY